MTPLLHAFSRHGTLILPAGLILGLLWQDLAHLARPLLAPAVFLMLTTILARVELSAVKAHVQRPRALVLGVVWALVAIPPAMAVLNRTLGVGEGLAFALIVYAASPPNFAAAAVGYILGLDAPLCLAVILATVVAHPLVAPLAVDLFAPGAAAIPSAALALRLFLLVGSALLGAALARHVMGPERQARLGSALDGLNVLFMVVFAVALMDGIPAMIAERPICALMLVAVCYSLHLGLNLATVAAFSHFERRTAFALGYAVGGRNIAIVMAALGDAAPADAWLFFAMLQFPIYTLPLVLRPLYRRLEAGQPS